MEDQAPEKVSEISFELMDLAPLGYSYGPESPTEIPFSFKVPEDQTPSFIIQNRENAACLLYYLQV